MGFRLRKISSCNQPLKIVADHNETIIDAVVITWVYGVGTNNFIVSWILSLSGALLYDKIIMQYSFPFIDGMKGNL